MIGMPQLLNKLPTASVRMLGKEITPSTVAKDLGINIDQSLTYNKHIKTVSTCLHNNFSLLALSFLVSYIIAQLFGQILVNITSTNFS